ncbi:hypothetical protein Lal_00022824 [Lupinus albus]|nr:hypothetical protein Lal_00022824 [Lupinus albus]
MKLSISEVFQDSISEGQSAKKLLEEKEQCFVKNEKVETSKGIKTQNTKRKNNKSVMKGPSQQQKNSRMMRNVLLLL